MQRSAETPRAEPEPLDQWKQTKYVRVLDRIGPLKFLVPGVGDNINGVIEMRNSGDVPSVTGRGACLKAVCVISKIEDDEPDELHRESVDRGRAYCKGF